MWFSAILAMALAEGSATEWNDRGNAAFRSGDFSAAASAYEHALSVAEEPERAGILSNLGAVDKRAGNYHRALARYSAAAELRARIYGESHAETGLARNNAAEMLRRLGRVKDAIALSQKALRSNLSPRDRAVVLNNHASLLEATRQFDDARQTYRTAIAMYDPAVQPGELAIALTNFGALESRLGNHGGARKLHAQAHELAMRAGSESPEVIAAVLHNQAITEFQAGNKRDALRRIQAAAELCTGSDPMQRAVVLANYAAILEHAGQKSKAARAREQAWALLPASVKWTVHADDLRQGTGMVDPSPGK